jgi:RNA polymerase sigma-70 factor (ECF subfamily)
LHDEGDDQLLRNVQNGDESAFLTLATKFQERIFRMACRITGDNALAEEAAARVLVKLWTKAGQWRGQSPAQTWIYRVTVRTAIDVQRGQQSWWQRWGNVLATTIDWRPGPSELVEQQEEREHNSSRLQDALMHLAPADRALLHLYYYENRHLAEIEEILGVNRDALKMRLLRARKRLRQLSRGEGFLGTNDEAD